MANDNAKRFVDAYNGIDKALRTIYNLKPNISFSEAVRRCAELSRVIAKYEDELLSYSRLRNAIVHNLFDNKVIAQPNTEVVEEMELILKLISSPPPVLSVAHTAVTFDWSIKLDKAIKMMANGGFSNVPVVNGGKILGVVTHKLIMEAIARVLKTPGSLEDYMSKTDIESVLTGSRNHYEIVADSLTVDSAMSLFHKNKKLRILVLTKTGCDNGKISGVVTIEDFSRMSDIMFNY